MSHDLIAEFRNRSGTLQQRLEHEIESARWRYNRVGGCGDFEVVVRREFADFPSIGLDWDMRLYKVQEAAPLNRAVQFTNSGGYGYLSWSVGSLQPIDSIIIHGHSVASGSGLRVQVDRIPLQSSIQTDGVITSFVSFAGFAGFGSLVGTTSDWAFAITLKTGADVATNQYFCGDHNSGGASQSFYIQLSGTFLTVAAFDTGGAQYSIAVVLAANTIYRVLASFLYSDKKLRVYIDGVLRGTTGAMAADMRAGVNFTLFRPGDLVNIPATSGVNLCDAVVYGEYLDADDALAEYNGTFTPGVARTAWWKMDEREGTDVLDSGPNGYPGVINGGLTWNVGGIPIVSETVTHNPTTILHILNTDPRSFAHVRIIATSLRNNEGAVSEVFGYQRSVTSAEVVQLETQQVTPDPANRIVHFPLNENTGRTINDIGPYSFNGSIVGSVAWTGGNGSTQSPGARTVDLWYRGYVSEVAEMDGGVDGASLGLRGHGYIGHLDRVLITASYQATKAESVVGDIMLNRGVTSKTSVVFCGTNIDTTSVSVTDMQFRNTPAGRALSQIADLVGTREWGVDRQAALFFRARRDPSTAPSSAYETFIAGKDLSNISITNRGDDLVNSVFVEGGVEQGQTIIVESVNSQSQVDYGRREASVQAASLISSVDAAQMGASIVAEKAATRAEVTFETAAPTMVETRVLTGFTQSAPVISLINISSRANYLLGSVDYSIEARRGFTSRVNAGEVVRSPAAYAASVDAEMELLKQRDLQSGDELRWGMLIAKDADQVIGIANTAITWPSSIYVRGGLFNVNSNTIISFDKDGLYHFSGKYYFTDVGSEGSIRSLALTDFNDSGNIKWIMNTSRVNSGTRGVDVFAGTISVVRGDKFSFRTSQGSVTVHGNALNEQSQLAVFRVGF